MSDAFDSSVLVPLLVRSLPRHAAAQREFSDDTRIAAHAAMETYSVVTRLPDGHRAAGELVANALRVNFEQRILPGPKAEELTAWLSRMAERGVVGGAIYDALVAESARRADMELVTFDRRARATYERVGARVRFVDPD